MNQELQIGLLGQFVVTRTGVPVTTFESNKVRALFAYLVAEQQREEPAWATWGDRYSAVQLFVQCAQRVQPNFQLEEATAVAVARICQLVDGMPLGLTLAAAWVRHLACTDIVREIEQTADFLATSLRNTPARHRSMRAVFDYQGKDRHFIL